MQQGCVQQRVCAARLMWWHEKRMHVATMSAPALPAKASSGCSTWPGAVLTVLMCTALLWLLRLTG